MSVPVVVARRSYQTCFRSTFKALVLLTLGIIVLTAGSIFSSGGQPAWAREGNRLEVTGLDAWDGSPVLDIKPYLPQLDSFPQTTIPAWAQGKPPE